MYSIISTHFLLPLLLLLPLLNITRKNSNNWCTYICFYLVLTWLRIPHNLRYPLESQLTSALLDIFPAALLEHHNSLKSFFYPTGWQSHGCTAVVGGSDVWTSGFHGPGLRPTQRNSVMITVFIICRCTHGFAQSKNGQSWSWLFTISYLQSCVIVVLCNT